MHTSALSVHLQRDDYDGFRLTEAVRPGLEHGVTPREGYRIARYRERGLDVPVLVAAVSRERLFDVFLDLLSVLSPVVDVVLESSHEGASRNRDLSREGIDLSILESYCCEHENMLLNDGCVGVAVVDRDQDAEVQFDEHKTFFIYADNLEPFERVLQGYGIERDDQMPLIMEAEHLHITQPRFVDELEQLCFHLGIAEPVVAV